MTVESTSKHTASAFARASIAFATFFPSNSIFPKDACISVPDTFGSILQELKLLLAVVMEFLDMNVDGVMIDEERNADLCIPLVVTVELMRFREQRLTDMSFIQCMVFIVLIDYSSRYWIY